MNILLAEDEQDLAELTIDYLEVEGITCDYAANGQQALNLVQNHEYDVLVLDVNMPKLDGFALCQSLKQQNVQTPVIFVTARDALEDKLTGFELGADDYLTKPFELDELVARLKVLSARKTVVTNRFELDDLQLDFSAKIATRGGKHLNLSVNQWTALETLAKVSPKAISRTQLEDAIWPDSEPSKDQLKMLLFRLRQLVDSNDSTPLIHTQRGIGVSLKLVRDESE